MQVHATINQEDTLTTITYRESNGPTSDSHQNQRILTTPERSILRRNKVNIKW